MTTVDVSPTESSQNPGNVLPPGVELTIPDVKHVASLALVTCALIVKVDTEAFDSTDPNHSMGLAFLMRDLTRHLPPTHQIKHYGVPGSNNDNLLGYWFVPKLEQATASAAV